MQKAKVDIIQMETRADILGCTSHVKTGNGDWRDGLAVRSMYCCLGPQSR